MSIIDSIYGQARPIQASGQQWMTSSSEPAGMGRMIQAPTDDPFTAKPWRGITLPVPPPVPAGEWMKKLYGDLIQRLQKGFELLDKPDLTEEQKSSFNQRIEQLAWQIHLMELVARELVPCPATACANRVGGSPGWMHPDHRDRYVWDMQQVHQAGRMAITLTTPGARQYTLVPWKSTPPVPGQLDPLDLAALARVAAMAGCDELTLLDRVATQEVTTTT